jgi:hypothetical protein
METSGGGQHEGDIIPHQDDVEQVVDEELERASSQGALTDLAAINLVYVSSDETQTDPYGRQIVRASSVSADGPHTAHGRFYRLK